MNPDTAQSDTASTTASDHGGAAPLAGSCTSEGNVGLGTEEGAELNQIKTVVRMAGGKYSPHLRKTGETRRLDAGMPAGCWNASWTLEYWLEARMPAGCRNASWLLECQLEAGMLAGGQNARR